MSTSAAELAPRRHVTVARVVAVAVIVLLAAGVLALHAAGAHEAVHVPAGAKSGDLRLHSCHYDTEDGSYDADCGTLVVPENRLDPGSRLIALPVTRIRATGSHEAAPVFYLQGGPGVTNMEFPYASRFAAHHDVVLVGYRGVDGSVRLDCPEVVSSLTGVKDLLATSTLDAYSAAFRTCATRLTDSGVDLAGYNMVQRVDDMEAARTALGYRSINLISESAGTRTAMVYSWRHPRSIHRSVMLGANPPGRYLYDGTTIDRQIKHYGDLCARDATCRSQTSDVVGTIRSEARHLPKRWGPLAIKPGNVKLATFDGFFHATQASTPLTGPQTIESWAAAADGDPSGLWFLSLMADLVIPTSHVWGDVPATAQIDAAAGAAYYAGHTGRGTIIGNPFTDSLWGNGGLVTAWPHAAEVDEYSKLRPTDVETLLISGDLDFATPAEFATKELLPSLRHGHQVVLHNLGHTGDTWTYETAASSRLINTFLDTGRVDDSAYPQRRMSFDVTPGQPWLAKIVVASLVGLAALTVLALVLLPLRLRGRTSVGTKTGALIRSVAAPLAGLGGWCLSLLGVLVLWPSMPVESPAIVMLSIGAPVALMTYLGWVHRHWSRTARTVGLCAATGGAAIGAWLGLHAVAGIMSVVTAVLGAVLLANFAVLLRDMLAGTPMARPQRRSEVAPREPVAQLTA
jgi:pimeloyl-ACP methyl ester carboxylesterase